MKKVASSKIGLSIIILAFGALFAQCSDEEYASGVSSNLIRFDEPEIDAWQQGNSDQTRGAIITSADEFKATYSEYKLFAWVKGKDADDNTYVPYIKGDNVDSQTNRSQSDYFWPGEDYQIHFMAFAPADFAASPTIDSDQLTISDYTVEPEVTQQKDLLYFSNTQSDGSGGDDKSQTIKFSHLLTAVQVKFADESQLTGVANVTLQDVYSTGTLTVKIFEKSNLAWSNQTNLSSFTSDNKSGAYIANGDYTFLMMPQTLRGKKGNTKAKLVINFEDGTSISKSLSETSRDWIMGHRVVYTIKYDALVSVFEVPEVIDLNSEDCSLSIDVKSVVEEYNVADDGTVTATSGDPIKWNFIHRPNWLTIANIADDWSSVSFDIASVEKEETRNKLIQDKPRVEDYDLSMNDKGQNTANCYIVNAAGTYKFPLVYGNALKDGQDYPEAYRGNGYYNYQGHSIDDPYIYNDPDCHPDKADLIWQDEKGLIKAVGLSADKTYLTFETASQSEIKQGNALIALRDKDDNILWSWHIWVTPYVPNQDADIAGSWTDKVITPKDPEEGSREKYVIMPINLGWCDESIYYKGREDSLVIQQDGTNITRTIKVIQRPKVVGVKGSQPYYQWCRKDPFMPADIADESFNITPSKKDTYFESKPSYDINEVGVEFKYIDSEQVNMPWTIQNPDVFAAAYNGDYAYFSGDMPWRCDIKTIYDPSPAGYKVCEWDALSVITAKNHDNTYDLTDGFINTPYDNSTVNSYGRYPQVHVANGWEFYCNPMQEAVDDNGKTIYKTDPSGGTFFMPISLFRQFNNCGKISYSGSLHGSGSTWVTSSGLTRSKGGLCLGYYGQAVRCHARGSTTQRLYGRAVRCMKE